VEYPAFLDIPVIQPHPLKPTTAISGQITPVIDGDNEGEEWAGAALYKGNEADLIQAFAYGMDQEKLYLRFDLADSLGDFRRITVYLNAPGDQDRLMVDLDGTTRLIAPASRVIEFMTGNNPITLYKSNGSAWEPDQVLEGELAVDGEIVELALPKSILGEVSGGSIVPAQIIITGTEPFIFNPSAPLAIQYFSFEPLTSVLLIEDPEGDDTGPGSYTYPKDGVFKAGDFDLTAFEVSSDGANVYFSFMMKAPITNGWNSPAGF
jgi:hypothetical protein